MKNWGKIILTTTITLSLTGYAIGAQLISPVLPSTAINHYLDCSIVNVGQREISGAIEICGFKGSLNCMKCEFNVPDTDPNSICQFVISMGSEYGILKPGESATMSLQFTSKEYCKFTIDGSPRDVRAVACVSNDLGETTACVNAE